MLPELPGSSKFPYGGDSNFTKINTLNSLKNPAFHSYQLGIIPMHFLVPFIVASADLPPHAPTVINKIMNYCVVLMACTAAVSFFQNQAIDHESNPHANVIRIWFISPLKLQKGCRLYSRIYGN
jgi:hypothetical protein